MNLPFGATEFFEAFRRYNEAIWPDLGLPVAAVVALTLAARIAVWSRR